MSAFRAAPVVAALCVAAALTTPASGLAQAPAAHAAKTCKVPSDDRWGPTYVTSLSVRSVSCAEGSAVVKAFDRCRVANGGADGTCAKPVRRYRCTERRGAAIPTQFDAKVSCRRGVARVAFGYTQFT